MKCPIKVKDTSARYVVAPILTLAKRFINVQSANQKRNQRTNQRRQISQKTLHYSWSFLRSLTPLLVKGSVFHQAF